LRRYWQRGASRYGVTQLTAPQLLQERAEVAVAHDEEVELVDLDAAAGVVGAHAAVVDGAVGQAQPVELGHVQRLAERHDPRIDRDRLERGQRAPARAAAERELLGVEQLEAGARAVVARAGVVDHAAVGEQARALHAQVPDELLENVPT
jgi:hypothetical protein